MVEKASPQNEFLEKEGALKVLNWAFDFGEGERLHLRGVFLRPHMRSWRREWGKIVRRFRKSG